MKKLLLILLCLPIIVFGQNVNIPDANFKAYLVGNSAINTNGDSEIQVSEANLFGGEIGVENFNISDLTGIEAFTALTYLDCSVNELISLDVSQNPALTHLDCSENQITSLDLSSNITLEFLTARENQLTSLDFRNGTNILILDADDFQSQYNPNLTCISVDNVNYSVINWTSIDAQQYFSANCGGTTDIQEHSKNKELLIVTDLLGRETKQTNQPLFYIYDDGTVEKRIVIEQ